jgi:hypothetical protein
MSELSIIYFIRNFYTKGNERSFRAKKILYCKLLKITNELPRSKLRGIKKPAAQGKSRSKLQGTNPERD